MIRQSKGRFLGMKEIIFYFICYFIGNLMTGFAVVKYFHRKDIREQGSGNVGARNAGRIYGKNAFILTFIGDALKGSLVIICGQMLDFTETQQLIGLTLAVIGHMKPVLLGFKGGKGVSTFIGGIITFEPVLALVIIIGFLLVFVVTKSFTKAGLASFTLIPFFTYFFLNSSQSTWALIPLVIIILIAHSKSLSERNTQS